MEINSPTFFVTVGEIARSVGHEDFYQNLIELPAQVLGCDRWLVVRYTRYGEPEIIFNNAMTEEALDLYNKGLCRLDPYLRLTHSGFTEGVVTLSSLREADTENVYYDEMFRTAIIFDELAILLSSPGRVCLALCVDRTSRAFTDQEIEQVEMLVPMIKGFHESHIEKVFAPSYSADSGLLSSGSPQAVMVMDRNHKQVWCNPAWEKTAAEYPSPLTELIHKNRDTGVVSLDQDRVLHWERLGCDFVIAPQGKICVIEHRGPGYVVESFESILHQFGDRNTLTDRERDIVELVLRGYPNALIAKELDISVGTVRNHRHRLYFKLDITTERELFHMFLSEITGVPMKDAPPAS